MGTSQTIIALRSEFNNQQLPILLRALHRIPAIWSLAQEPEIVKSALEHFGNQLDAWTPANLAFLQIDPGLPQATLIDFNQPLPDEIISQAEEIYEKFRRREISSFDDFSAAGLLALALRERYRILGSWEIIFQEIYAVNASNLQTVLACLYTLIENPEDIFMLLCQSGGYLTLCIEAIYAQPLPSNLQAQLAASLVAQAPLYERLELLDHLEKYYPEDAKWIATELIHLGPHFEDVELKKDSAQPSYRWLDSLTDILYAATLYRLAEKDKNALQIYQTIHNQLNSFTTDINRWLLMEAQAASRFDFIDTFLSESLKPGQISPNSLGSISLRLQHDGQVEAARNLLAGQAGTPETILFDAVLEHQAGQETEARALLSQAVAAWQSSDLPPEAGPLTEAAQLLLELGQPKEALILASLLHHTRPLDCEALMLLGRALRETGNASEATQYAYLAAGLDPENLEIHRELANCLESAEDWETARVEREYILQHSNQQKFSKTVEANGINRIDARALAITALHTGRTEEALSICWSLLETDGDDGLTHKTLGDIYKASGEPELALEHYLRANQLVPDYADTWLDLAEIQQQSGDTEHALETLRTATQALPDNSRIHLALGNLYIAMDHPTQAMGVLKKAADLEHLTYRTEVPELMETMQPKSSPIYLAAHSAEICQQLGSVLLELGHTAEAQVILNRVYNTPEYKISTAYIFARALIAQGKEQEALAALSIAYQNNPSDPALALEYSRLLCKLGDQPEQAVIVLENLLANNSKIPEAVALMAEALAALDRCEEAIAYYQRAMDTPLMGDPRWSIRLAIGLGHVAVELGKPDIAIAALQDAIQTSPGHLTLHQKLSDAFLSADLPEDASESAQRAYEIAPADLANLEWYASQMIRLGEPAHALVALESAADLSANDPEIYLQQAQILRKLSKPEAATEKYQKAIEMPDVTLEQLFCSAQGLLELGDPETAIQHLERVREGALPQAAPISQDILVALASGYSVMNQSDKALEVLEEALQRKPDSIELLKQKAEVHFLLGQSAAALACLNQVINQQPNDPGLHLLAADVYIQNANYVMALDHARKYLKYAPADQAVKASMYTARLTWQLFLQEETKKLLEIPALSAAYENEHKNEQEANFVLALIAITDGDLPTIASIEEKLHSTSSDSAGVRALQAYLYAIKNEESQSLENFILAVEAAAQSTNLASYEYEVLIEAAIYLNEYGYALDWVQKWQQADPKNPRARLLEVRILVERAETQRFLASVGAYHRAQQIGGVAQDAITRFESAVDYAIKLLGLPMPATKEDYVLPLASADPVFRWHVRGQAVFSPLEEMPAESQSRILQKLARLEPEPANNTAYVSALLRAGRQAQVATVGRDYPAYPPSLAQLAISLLDTNPPEAMASALSAIETIVALREHKMLPAYQAIIALAAGQAGEPNQAYQAIINALGDWPEEAEWHCLAAKFSRETENVSAELNHLEKAVNLAPGSLQYQVELAEAYFRAGAFIRAVNAYENVCELESGRWQNWVRLAEIQAERNEIKLASQAAEKALKLAPEQADILQFAAELALLDNDWGRAQKLSRHLLETQPDNAGASYILSRALTGLNRREEAITVLDQALKYSGRPIQLYLERIRLVRSLQGMQPAYQSLLALSQQYPDHPAVLALLAEYLQEQGRSSEALDAAHAALQKADEHLSKSEIARLHILIGRTLRRTGQLDQAIHQFTEALQLNPAQIDLFLELGKAHQERRQVIQALEIYQKAIQLYPDDPRPYQQAGLALKESKDYLGAEQMIRRAAELSPHDLSIHRLLGSLVALNLVHSAQ
jgi:tetratricopeptide (TPR) repeat protein